MEASLETIAPRLQGVSTAYSKGSLEPGKLADLVVLSEDPFEVSVDALKDLQVEITVVGGRVVHEGRG